MARESEPMEVFSQQLLSAVFIAAAKTIANGNRKRVGDGEFGCDKSRWAQIACLGRVAELLNDGQDLSDVARLVVYYDRRFYSSIGAPRRTVRQLRRNLDECLQNDDRSPQRRLADGRKLMIKFHMISTFWPISAPQLT